MKAAQPDRSYVTSLQLAVGRISNALPPKRFG
jgi:hypothetical protein